MHKERPFFYLASSFVFLMLLFSASSAIDSIPAPTTTIQGTRGLTHTASAEPLGAGRLVFSLLGTWYHQDRGFTGAPVAESNVMTGSLSFAYGINSHIDLFLSLPAYFLVQPSPAENTFGIGSFSTGLAGSLPFPPTSPLHLGAQLAIVAGTATNQINMNNEDGYNYFETRTGFDFVGKIIETLEFGDESRGIKFHLNQGFVSSLESEHSTVLLLSGGIQGIVHRMLSLGVELNSRTTLEDIKVTTDPLWITPSVQLRTPYFFTAVLGADITLSQDRSKTAVRALEPFRLFGGFVFSFDALARNRREAAEDEQRKLQEKTNAEQKAADAQALADSLARKAREDSLAMAKKMEEERAREQMRADSLLKKAREDSITLAETKKKLEEEMSKRSDAEKQLLSTGLLLLDAVYFSSGKSDVSMNSRPYLTIIGKMLLKYPKLQIEVGGHTDNTGRHETNMNLSYARAQAVQMFLIQVAPELSGRITAMGYGPTMPKADNKSAAGREMNRRVELKVLNKDALAEYNK